jgi:hypothetical protein
MKTKQFHLVRRMLPLSISAALLVFAQAAQATVVSTIQASGQQVLGGNALPVVVDGPVTNVIGQTSGSVDILPINHDGNGNETFIHTYGSTGGEFGSRASGVNNFFASGLFTQNYHVSNDTGVDQNYNYTFRVTPGQLSVFSGAAFTGVDQVSSQFSIDIQLNSPNGGASVFNTAANLTKDSAGNHYTQSGTNIYTQSSNENYSINPYFATIDLGMLRPGESLDLTYNMLAQANGNVSYAPVLTRRTETITYITGYTYEPVGCDPRSYGGGDETLTLAAIAFEGDGYGGDGWGYGGGGWEPSGPPCTSATPHYDTYTYTFDDFIRSGAEVRSGDPDGIGGNGNPLIFAATGISSAPAAPAAVPEPASATLLGLGLMGLAGLRRRNQKG